MARAVFRLTGGAVWTFGCFVLWALLSLLLIPAPRARLRGRHVAVRHWSRGLCRLIGMRRRVIGTPPGAPFLLASNHLSFLDILLLLSWLDGVFIAKQEMRSWPLLGPLAGVTGTIWLNREVRRDAVRVLEKVGEAIARGDGVILFPEGTTSSGAVLLPMKSALFDWAARERYPVHCAAVTYRTPPGSTPAGAALSWPAGVTFGRHLMTVLRLKHFDAIVDFSADPVVASSRGEVAARVQATIARRFVPLVPVTSG